MGDDRLSRAKDRYEQAVFGDQVAGLATAERELDGVEADLALARGRILHARYLAERREDPRELSLFERAADLYQQLGDRRGEAEARFWEGCFHQVVRDDGGAALAPLQRSYDLASQVGDAMTMSYAARHLGFHAMEAGDVELARERLVESLRLRREVGHRPAVAAALLALAELAARDASPDASPDGGNDASPDGGREQAEKLLDEAEAEARDSGARRILHWIGLARAELAADS